MSRFLRSTVLLFALLTTILVSAQNTLTLGYCNDEITSGDYRLSLRYTANVMGAIRIPASRLASLKGKNAHITKIRLGAEAGIKGTYLWVRPSLNKSAEAIQRLGVTEDGWNEVTFTKPYEITGDKDLYVGFNGSMPKGTSLIFNGRTTSNGANVAVNNVWDDMSGLGEGSLCIQCVIEADGVFPANDLGIETVSMDTEYARNGDTRRFFVTLSNYGSEQHTLPELHYQIAGGTEHTVQPLESVVLMPGDSYTSYIDAKIEDVAEGYADMKVWMDVGDECADNDSYTSSFCAYTTSYPHKMLMEQFTTLSCVNCPYGHNLFNALAGNRSNVVWVAHHVGFGTDQFTVDASEDIMGYGVTAAPMGMFDRCYIEGLSENSKPAFSIGYGNLSTGVTVMSAPFDEILARPAFVSVNVTPDYDPSSRRLSVKVNGSRNGLFSQLYANSSLTVYLVEDSCVSKRPQTGGTPADTIHSHVLRQALTESLGNAIEWDGDSYELTFETTLDAQWKTKDMKIVAFVHRPISDGYKNSLVLNAESVSVAEATTGVGSVKTADSRILSRSYYNLQGQRLSNIPQSGVYVERTQYSDGVRSEKRMVK